MYLPISCPLMTYFQARMCEMQLKEKIIAQIEEQLPTLPEEDILFLAGYLLGKQEEKEKHEPEPH